MIEECSHNVGVIAQTLVVITDFYTDISVSSGPSFPNHYRIICRHQLYFLDIAIHFQSSHVIDESFIVLSVMTVIRIVLIFLSISYKTSKILSLY